MSTWITSSGSRVRRRLLHWNRDGSIAGGLRYSPGQFDGRFIAHTLANLSAIRSDLKPLRISLHLKKSKRCPTCYHIPIKSEQKPQSVRPRIKVSATSYLPFVGISLLFLNPLLRRTLQYVPLDRAPCWEKIRILG